MKNVILLVAVVLPSAACALVLAFLLREPVLGVFAFVQLAMLAYGLRRLGRGS